MQRIVIAVCIERLDFSGNQVYPLDAATVVVGRLAGRPRETIIRAPTEAAIVADITMSIRPHCCAVRTATKMCDALQLAVRQHAGQSACGDLHDEHAAVRQRYRTFRKAQPCC